MAEVDRELSGYERLMAERDRLQRARHALVAEDRPLGARLSGSAVLDALARHAGITTKDLAFELGRDENSVRAHLHRALKSGRCTRRERLWYSGLDRSHDATRR